MVYLYGLICTIATMTIGAAVVMPVALAIPIAGVAGVVLFIASGKLVEAEESHHGG